MKTPRNKRNSAKQMHSKKVDFGAPPTVEQIRQRAQEIFLARGGTPGKELDDWLRAERELKQERTGANPSTGQ